MDVFSSAIPSTVTNSSSADDSTAPSDSADKPCDSGLLRKKRIPLNVPPQENHFYIKSNSFRKSILAKVYRVLFSTFKKQGRNQMNIKKIQLLLSNPNPNPTTLNDHVVLHAVGNACHVAVEIALELINHKYLGKLLRISNISTDTIKIHDVIENIQTGLETSAAKERSSISITITRI